MQAINDRIVKKAGLCLALVMAVMAGGVTGVTAASAECVTAPQWHDLMAEASPTLVIADPETVGAKLATVVVGAYNGKASQGQIAPDTVLMLLARDRATGFPLGQALFGLVDGGCVIGTYLVPLPSARIGDPS
jgi:hypothetical protein